MRTAKTRTGEKELAPKPLRSVQAVQVAHAPVPAQSAATEDPHAPVTFFDRAPTLSLRDGVVGLTLTAERHLPLSSGQTSSDSVVVGHLRCSVSAARQLHDALGKALLLAARPGGDKH